MYLNFVQRTKIRSLFTFPTNLVDFYNKKKEPFLL